ncbi:hypothetical protein WISP_28072 [Willisornis vidua]|uniref:Uncharacterized protein n=1 Tax=Willisornis vidua TaxID=1566151 RepID=A0ABQ9DQK5_9PASS|nr:hypothetical protein WISP_28072 [Willisornis vidua]
MNPCGPPEEHEELSLVSSQFLMAGLGTGGSQHSIQNILELEVPPEPHPESVPGKGWPRPAPPERRNFCWKQELGRGRLQGQFAQLGLQMGPRRQSQAAPDPNLQLTSTKNLGHGPSSTSLASTFLQQDIQGQEQSLGWEEASGHTWMRSSEG